MTTKAQPSAQHRAEALKERVYVTFTGLAVVLALQSHSETLTPGEAASTLAITVVGTLLAVFVADFVSHLAVHAKTPSRSELAHMARTSFGAFGAIVLPLIFIAVAAMGRWSVETSLRASTVALITALVLIGYLAVRRVKMSWRKKVIVLGAEFLLGLAVVGLELLAHG
ncbi:hypothetical protein ACIQH5_18890 [Paenarthrobacter sp. NPDC091711]|uniref:hypothetical protein n=1 Tax=Paenarthrobacter sp. NPDC091711 TaxID=3364385 RepID=UPI00380A28C8